MAVSRDYAKINIILNHSAVQFAIDFDTNFDDYGNAINIEVYLGIDRLIQNEDFTISGKTITYPDAVNHQGEKLTIFRATPIEQPVDFVDNGNFTLEDIEAMGDRAIMILQEQGVNLADTINAQESALRAEQYKDTAIEKASDAEDWAEGTRSDGQSPQHSSESAKHYAEEASGSAASASASEDNAASYKLVSEGFATGQQNGTDVPSSSPYYQNNSKHYKEQAATSAVSAGASESKAKDWADKAEDTEVETNKYSARHWAAKASTSASSASTSAANANVSEAKAEKWAEEAEDTPVETGKYSAKHYSLKAASSASSASADATSAAASEAKAEEWAEKAEDTQVEPGKYSAKHYAAKAGASASAASTSETNAGTSETNAGLSATAAAASETKAEKWAEETEDVPVETGKYSAKHYASKASASATSAGEAKDDAVSAKNAASASASLAADWAEKDTEVETGKHSAKYWAEQSDASASNASTSETNAGLSENAASESASTADTKAQDSEAWATGKRNGTDVPSSDPAYHNNSKYYLDQTILTIAGVLRYKGTWTITSQTDYSSIGTPRSKGDMYYCQGTATTIDGVTYTQGDLIIFKQDVASGTTITTSMIDKVDNTETVTPDNTATLKNKTINIADNTLVGVQPTLSTAQQSAVDSGITSAKVDNYDSHLSNTSNPHSVTKAQVGLGNCDNTADADKPISTATQTALDGKQATIDSSHKLSSDLVDDTSATHLFVSSTEKASWNAKQGAIDSSHELSADLVDDTSTTHKFVTSTEKSTWNDKQSALNTDQMAAVNSGATTTKIGNYDTHIADGTIHVTSSDKSTWSGKQDKIDSSHKLSADLVDDTSATNKFVTASDKTTWNGKQSALDTTQMAAVNSGITSTLVGKISTNESAISTINGKIPSAASSTNQLADKSYVDTGLSGKQDALSTAQLDAANSGITSTKVGNYDTHIADTGIHVTSSDKSTWNGKQSALDTTQMAAVNSGINSTLVGKMVTTDGSQTLTNKTVDKASNTVTTSPLEISTTPYTLTPTKEMNVVITGTSVALTLGNGPYEGYSLPILAKKDCTVTYTGAGGATFTDTIKADWYVHYIWRGNWLREMSITMSGTGSDGTSLGTLYVLTRR